MVLGAFQAFGAQDVYCNTLNSPSRRLFLVKYIPPPAPRSRADEPGTHLAASPPGDCRSPVLNLLPNKEPCGGRVPLLNAVQVFKDQTISLGLWGLGYPSYSIKIHSAHSGALQVRVAGDLQLGKSPDRLIKG